MHLTSIDAQRNHVTLNSMSALISGKPRSRLRVQAVFWNPMGSGSVGYTLTELFDNFPADSVERTLWCLCRSPDDESPRAYQKAGIPKLLFRALCKAGVSMRTQRHLARHVALRSIKKGDIVYVWGPYDLQLIKRSQKRGATVVGERTNCMGAMYREALIRAYGRRGLTPPAGFWPPKAVADERDQMLQCDFVTAPNALVKQSLLDAGAASDRILETSYGYSAKRLASAIGIERPERRPVFAFVGEGSIRKGLDVLLEAWEQSAIQGTLLLAGRITPEIRSAYQHVLARSDVQPLGYVSDIAAVYAAADVFVFPSHEEGGPQVTYEAAACGLPSIVSPMGSARVVRHGVEGFIVDPLHVDELSRTMKLFADDVQLRRKLGAQAAERAREFEWSKVSARLYEMFCKIAPRAN